MTGELDKSFFSWVLRAAIPVKQAGPMETHRVDE
jgi:hypothetical protein